MNRRPSILRDVVLTATLGCTLTGISLASDDLTTEDRQARLEMELAVVVIGAVVESSGSHPGSNEAIVRLDSVAELRQAPFDGSFKERDPWDKPYLYLADKHSFVVFSGGPDGRLDSDYAQTTLQEWQDMKGDDFIIADGHWIKRPLGQRGRQKQTMADLRSIATAIEEFSIDNNFYPTALSIAELEPQLSPIYIRTLPRFDAWGNPFVVQCEQTSYSLRSMGRDGLPDKESSGGATHTYESDLVFEMGSFTQWPEGSQD